LHAYVFIKFYDITLTHLLKFMNPSLGPSRRKSDRVINEYMKFENGKDKTRLRPIVMGN